MNKLLRIDNKVDFLSPGSELRIIRSADIALINLNTSVHGLCFKEEKILMVNDKENR